MVKKVVALQVALWGDHKESEVAIVKPSTKPNQTESVQAEGVGLQKGRGEGPSDRKWQI